MCGTYGKMEMTALKKISWLPQNQKNAKNVKNMKKKILQNLYKILKRLYKGIANTGQKDISWETRFLHEHPQRNYIITKNKPEKIYNLLGYLLIYLFLLWFSGKLNYFFCPRTQSQNLEYLCEDSFLPFPPFVQC